MISYLSGTLAEKGPTHLVVDVGGVGFSVQVPLSTYERAGQVGQPIKILTYLNVREDALQLFGFLTEGERDLFELLISVNGVGPQVAQKVLSGVSVNDFKRFVAAGDGRRLTTIPGIGKKTAERLVVELRDRIGEVRGAEEAEGRPGGRRPGGRTQEAVLALVALGATQASAERAVAEVVDEEGDLPVEQVIKRALRKI
jgi:Holliday junction DNA helicase RuvA